MKPIKNIPRNYKTGDIILVYINEKDKEFDILEQGILILKIEKPGATGLIEEMTVNYIGGTLTIESGTITANGEFRRPYSWLYSADEIQAFKLTEEEYTHPVVLDKI